MQPRFYEIEPEENIIAIDFDGTCVEADYPRVGKDLPWAVTVLQLLVANNCKLILYTMRDGQELIDAINWFEYRLIPLYGIQRHPLQQAWTDGHGSPKCLATHYIDDRNIGIPLRNDTKEPAVDWDKLLVILIEMQIIK